MEDLGIILTTSGVTMQTSCIKKAPSSAYHKTQPRAAAHTRVFLTTTTLVWLKTFLQTHQLQLNNKLALGLLPTAESFMPKKAMVKQVQTLLQILLEFL
jgi:hypothetical protein